MARALITPGRLAAGFAATKLALHLATLGSYGYFRDELYYLACADRLAWGYVDHPPLSIALLALWRALVGDGLSALHVLPALIGAAIVGLVGRTIIELGGGRLAVVLGGAAMLTAPGRIATDHFVSMNGLDSLVWALAAWLMVRVHGSNARRDWIALGVVLGLGLLNKWSVLWLGAGVAAALLLTEWRRELRRSGPWLAAAIAGLLFAPNLLWQRGHDWPTLEFMRNALGEKYVRLAPLDFAEAVALSIGVASTPLLLAGAITPFVWPPLRRAQPIAIVFVTTLLIVGGTRGKPEYVTAASALPIAAGAVAAEALLASARASVRSAVCAVIVALQVALAAVALPFVLPILPVPRFVAYAKTLGVEPGSSEKKTMGLLPQHYADMHGWPELVGEAERAWSTLTLEERQRAAIWTVSGGYGSAAAIDVLGRHRGLPGAISGHNNYWLWGPGAADGSVVVLLGGPEDRFRELFDSLERVGTVHCAPCMPYEDEKPVWIGRGMRKSFADVWPLIKHYD